MVRKFLTKARRLKKRFDQINEIAQRVEHLQLTLGRIESRLLPPRSAENTTLQEYEFQVYSQWGEDGIIQYLIHSLEIPNKNFVEFGVYDYRESNTRFLLQHNNWSGLILDSSNEFIEQIKKEPLYFRNDLKAVCAFVTRENINELLSSNGLSGDIGLLSIDIDGNDYWIWEAINCVSPRIVICEYDSLLGDTATITTPYEASFDRVKAHYSFVYGGASIAALHRLAKKKGYALVGSNSAGNNAFFVRNDVVKNLPVLSPQEAYVKAKFRNSKNDQGQSTFLSFEESRRLIAGLSYYDVTENMIIQL